MATAKTKPAAAAKKTTSPSTPKTKPTARVVKARAAAAAPAKSNGKKITSVVVDEVPQPKRTHTYMNAETRKAQLDGHLLRLIKSAGINGTTRAELARKAECSNGLLRVYYPGGVEAMRVAAVVLAATAGDAKTVKKAIADGFPKANLPRKFHALVK